MKTSGLFRCTGDILFDDHQPLPGQISNVQLKKFSETSNFLQLYQPLTPEHPYFFAKIKAIADESCITIGIAGPNIDNDAQPGHWNNTVGYHSDSGDCFTSHKKEANTRGENFTVDDTFGVLVTYFGKDMSTVMFLKNGVPISTRYLYETDHSKFLPTIYLEHGPIDLGIMWPTAALDIPRYDETNMLNWIKGPEITYDKQQNMFFFNEERPETVIQSPQPLTKAWSHYEVIVQEVTEDGEGPSVGVATCSPLKPSPTCILLRDFFRWKADGIGNKVHVGQRIGFGVHYSPDRDERMSDRDNQMVLCFVTLDSFIVYLQIMIQPTGGFYPLVALSRGVSRVSFDVETNREIGNETSLEMLDRIYRTKLPEALEILHQDSLENELESSMFRTSDAIKLDINSQSFLAQLSAEHKGIHVVQFNYPLMLDKCYFFIEINKLNEDSVLSLGIAGSEFPLNKHPGKLAPSTGWVSRDGKMYFDSNCNGLIEGMRFGEGDTVGLHLLSINENLSVVLFIKNYQPIGTRYVTTSDPSQLLPTVSLCGNSYDVEVKIFWQNRVSIPPIFREDNLQHWCCSQEGHIDVDNNAISFRYHRKPVILQCPQRLTEGFNHFEIQITEEYGTECGKPPPVITLSAPGSRGVSTNVSHFSLECLRFSPTGDAEGTVKLGDLVGWGMLVPQSEWEKENRLVVCYLTINRSVMITRVMYEPVGGLYPMVFLPSDLNHVKFDFSALIVRNHPLTDDVIDVLLKNAQDVICEEREVIASGKDFDELNIDKSRLIIPLEKTVNNLTAKHGSQNFSSTVLQVKGVDRITRAVREERECQINGNSDGRSSRNSKACVLL